MEDIGVGVELTDGELWPRNQGVALMREVMAGETERDLVDHPVDDNGGGLVIGGPSSRAGRRPWHLWWGRNWSRCRFRGLSLIHI